APAAAPLCAVLGDRLRLNVAAVRECDDHLLGRDQVLDREVGAVRDDLGAPLVTELIADRVELVADHRRDARRLGQHIKQVDDLHHHLAVFAGDLFLLEPGQALQPQLEYRQRLPINAVLASAGVAAALISAMISSTFDSATASPSRMCPRSRALRSSKRVRRTTISRRCCRKNSRNCFRLSRRGWPSTSATMFMPKLSCSCVSLY